MSLNEYEIFQNKALASHVIWEFAKNYQKNNKYGNQPSLMLTMPVLPLCFNKRVIDHIKDRNFKSGSLLKTLDEHSDIFSGLQERMEDMAKLTFESVYLASVAKLIKYDREQCVIVPINRALPKKYKELVHQNKDYYDILQASKRIGAWFGLFNESEIYLYFNIHL